MNPEIANNQDHELPAYQVQAVTTYSEQGILAALGDACVTEPFFDADGVPPTS